MTVVCGCVLAYLRLGTEASQQGYLDGAGECMNMIGIALFLLQSKRVNLGYNVGGGLRVCMHACVGGYGCACMHVWGAVGVRACMCVRLWVCMHACVGGWGSACIHVWGAGGEHG